MTQLNTVSSGDKLTAQMWNNLVNAINEKSDGQSLFSGIDSVNAFYKADGQAIYAGDVFIVSGACFPSVQNMTIAKARQWIYNNGVGVKAVKRQSGIYKDILGYATTSAADGKIGKCVVSGLCAGKVKYTDDTASSTFAKVSTDNSTDKTFTLERCDDQTEAFRILGRMARDEDNKFDYCVLASNPLFRAGIDCWDTNDSARRKGRLMLWGGSNITITASADDNEMTIAADAGFIFRTSAGIETHCGGIKVSGAITCSYETISDTCYLVMNVPVQKFALYGLTGAASETLFFDDDIFNQTTTQSGELIGIQAAAINKIKTSYKATGSSTETELANTRQILFSGRNGMLNIGVSDVTYGKKITIGVKIPVLLESDTEPTTTTYFSKVAYVKTDGTIGEKYLYIGFVNGQQ